MGNIFCECNKRDELNFSESNKSLLSKKKSKKKEMKGFSKNLTKIQNWSTLRNSSLIGKGVGDPKEKYTFLDQLSKSETAMLYKVKLKKTGELRSIKIIKKGDHSMSTEKAIITEIELLETIDHPNILKIYEFYDCPENICIIGELGRGGPLSKCIKKIINESETEEVMKAFGTMKGYNQKDFENILALIDIYKDKYIDYEKFKTMMIRIIE